MGGRRPRALEAQAYWVLQELHTVLELGALLVVRRPDVGSGVVMHPRVLHGELHSNEYHWRISSRPDG